MVFFNRIILLTQLSLFGLYSYAGPLELYYRNVQKNLKNQYSIAAKTTDEYNFNQLINHDNPSLGSFAQRFYLDETYGTSEDSPVFLYICGEGTCSPNDLDGAIRTVAQKFHAKLVALEHRYYGKSLPASTLATPDLQYLTTAQAIEDLAYFQQKIRTENHWTGKWIAFGGSYPGSLAAYFRLKHPELITGALASSAPVKAKQNFTEYDTLITKVVGLTCAKNIRDSVHVIENALQNKTDLKYIKELFNATEVEDPVDFLSLVADVEAIAVQYGDQEAFCTALSSAATPLIGYAKAAKTLFKELNVNPAELTTQGLMSEDPKDYTRGNDGLRQWYYQTCTEYGYEQNANPTPSKSTRSGLINSRYQREVCNRLFGLNNQPNVELINQTYYLPLMDVPASNIYFTNGEADPWSTLSLSKKNKNAENPSLSYHLIKWASHCVDLAEPTADDSKSLIAARKKLDNLLESWLKT